MPEKTMAEYVAELDALIDGLDDDQFAAFADDPELSALIGTAATPATEVPGPIIPDDDWRWQSAVWMMQNQDALIADAQARLKRGY